MGEYAEIRVRELTERGSWPWRWIVEGLKPAHMVKRWLWSRKATEEIPAEWVRLPHGVRGLRPLSFDDADALADHYEAANAGTGVEG